MTVKKTTTATKKAAPRKAAAKKPAVPKEEEKQTKKKVEVLYEIPDKVIKGGGPYGADIERTIAITVRPADILTGMARRAFADGSIDFDLPLVDWDKSKKELPAGVEVIVTSCKIGWEYLPCMFSYKELGTYTAQWPAWIAAKDLEITHGNTGIRLSADDKVVQ